ncbi:hypothetical protein IFM89_018781 [Coptis chinensis]|uniref:Phenylalanine--tRNA ligase alpha subunit n=1 Tax=Coptis chinensis TaxID=261450 RepID=A0A835I3C2_9MAGN|nr:hypothetical protein IFM89_018781 [Coptis chinensis]
MGDTEKAILSCLNTQQEIQDSGDFSKSVNIDHSDIVNVVKSLHGFGLVLAQEIKRENWVLSDEGNQYAEVGSPEVQLFNAVPPQGIARDELQKKVAPLILKIGSQYAVKSKWIEMGKQQVTRKVQCVEDHVKDLLLQIKDGKGIGSEDINLLKRRKLIELQTWNGFSLKKGPNFVLERKKLATDLTRELLQSGDWKNMELKPYNFSAKALPPSGGHLHPLLKACFQYLIFISVFT